MPWLVMVRSTPLRARRVVLMRSPEPRDELIGRLLTELALEPDEEPELVAALGDRLREIDGGWSLEPRERRLVTFWWDAA